MIIATVNMSEIGTWTIFISFVLFGLFKFAQTFGILKSKVQQEQDKFFSEEQVKIRTDRDAELVAMMKQVQEIRGWLNPPEPPQRPVSSWLCMCAARSQAPNFQLLVDKLSGIEKLGESITEELEEIVKVQTKWTEVTTELTMRSNKLMDGLIQKLSR